jgi:hypothetical protein
MIGRPSSDPSFVRDQSPRPDRPRPGSIASFTSQFFLGVHVVKLYVGNLSFSTTEGSLEALFSNYGNVEEVAVITDRDTGRSRGFGFVTMDDNGAREAMEALNGNDFEGRSLTVNEAKPRSDRGGPRGGGGGGGRRDRW